MYREIVDNVLSGTKAGFKAILNIFKHPKGECHMWNQKSSSKLSTTLLALILGASVFMAGPVWAEGYVTDPATGRTWTKPEYGGTLTWAVKHYPKSTDGFSAGGWAGHFASTVLEQMAFGNWDVPRELVDDLAWVWTGPNMYAGALATSWAMPDDTTFIWNVRKGVHWHDKPPMSGREFNAHDVVWNYHRYAGMGDFAEAGPAPIGYILGALEFEICNGHRQMDGRNQAEETSGDYGGNNS